MPRTISFIAVIAAALAVAVPTAAAEGQPVTSPDPVDARSEGLNRLYGLGDYAPAVVADNRFRIDPTAYPGPVATGSSRDLEWPQIGLGLALLIAFAIGAYLVVRSRQRPLAH